MKRTLSKKDIKNLDKLMSGAKNPLIVVHTNPDPDAIASAYALKYLLDKKYDLQASIAYSGNIGRAENQAMIKELKIHMKQISKINWKKYDLIMLVDTQPGSGNNALPEEITCHLVLDHHPSRRQSNCKLKFIYPELGAVATLLIEWLKFMQIEIPANLATALVYAINSESQNLNREVNQRDIDAYLYVYVRCNLRKLARIIVPPLPRRYFISVATALRKAVTYRNLICAHLGDVPSAEIVSEMADFLVRHERIGWSLCTGRFKDRLIISLRSRNSKILAGELIQKLVNDTKNVGGHDRSAGGFINIQAINQNDIEILENTMSKNFAALQNYDDPDWKPLLGN
jgi:nanoRNase/pAp phosphatase (c-di-AMP/oligoRNAs hydrolase)